MYLTGERSFTYNVLVVNYKFINTLIPTIDWVQRKNYESKTIFKKCREGDPEDKQDHRSENYPRRRLLERG